jgi:small subunit ribosomal protein S16
VATLSLGRDRRTCGARPVVSPHTGRGRRARSSSANEEYTGPVAVKIKLARMGKIREPHYRVVVADARNRRDGRVIETIGEYHPKSQPSDIRIDSERAQYWLGVGAIPTEPVHGLLKITGDWQKFKGLPGAEGRLQPQPEKVDKQARFNEELAKVSNAGNA